MFNFNQMQGYTEKILFATQYTLLIALASAFFGFILGTLLALMKSSKIGFIRSFANVYTDVFRGTPAILQLSFVYYVVFGAFNINPMITAIFTFSLNSAAYVSEIMRAGIKNVDKGQIEAAKAMGVSEKDIALDIIIPQAIRKTIPPLISEVVTLIKESSIVYIISVRDIMYYVNRTRSDQYLYFEPLIIGGICYYVLVKLVTLFGRYMEKRLSYDKN
jgi:arginine/lysine/histidine transport system permease protein